MTPTSASLGAGQYPRTVATPVEPHVPDSVTEPTRSVLERACDQGAADAVLLSGGLDSSISALLSTEPRSPAICVLTPGGEDEPYCELMADHLDLELHRIELDLDEVLDHAPPVTHMMRSFDPMEVRNTVVQYIGLRAAREIGAQTVATGDGADELFAGYSYMTAMDPDDLAAYRSHIAETMRFSAERVAEVLGIKARSPFLDEGVIEHALRLPNEHLVREHEGRAWGKWALREAFVDELPEEVLWRWKDPLEVGSGTTNLGDHLTARIEPEAFEERASRLLEEEGVRIRDPEHLAYYAFYRRVHPPPREFDTDVERRCPGCRGPLTEATRFCRTCGWYGGPPDGAGGDP